jgi:hypothetical protein
MRLICGCYWSSAEYLSNEKPTKHVFKLKHENGIKKHKNMLWQSLVHLIFHLSLKQLLQLEEPLLQLERPIAVAGEADTVAVGAAVVPG